MQAESQLDAQIHALAPPCDTPPVASSQLDDAGNSEEGTASTQGSKPKKDLALSCHFTQCDYDGTFPSRWELGRHIRSKHTRSKTFTCPYPGCLRGLHVPTFARPDKLTSHIRDCHVNRSSDALLDCPASNCSFLPDTLCNLGNHIRLRHFLQSTNANKQRELCGDGVEVLRAVANASSSVPRKEKSNGTD